MKTPPGQFNAGMQVACRSIPFVALVTVLLLAATTMAGCGGGPDAPRGSPTSADSQPLRFTLVTLPLFIRMATGLNAWPMYPSMAPALLTRPPPHRRRRPFR